MNGSMNGAEMAIHCMMRNKTIPPRTIRLPLVARQSLIQLTIPKAMRNRAMKLPMRMMTPQLRASAR